MVPPKAFYTVLDKVSYGDWFMLYLLSKNLDPFHYRDVVIHLSDRLDEERTGTYNKKHKSMLLDETDADEAGAVPEKKANSDQENETSI